MIISRNRVLAIFLMFLMVISFLPQTSVAASDISVSVSIRTEGTSTEFLEYSNTLTGQYNKMFDLMDGMFQDYWADYDDFDITKFSWKSDNISWNHDRIYANSSESVCGIVSDGGYCINDMLLRTKNDPQDFEYVESGLAGSKFSVWVVYINRQYVNCYTRDQLTESTSLSSLRLSDGDDVIFYYFDNIEDAPLVIPYTASSPVEISSAASQMSVSVPTSLPVTVAANGTVSCASNCKITNNSVGPVLISNVALENKNSYVLKPYTFDEIAAAHS